MDTKTNFYRKNCLIIPGLNLHPDQMDGLRRSLEFHQISSKITTLPGIDPNNRQRNPKENPINFEILKEHIRDEIRSGKFDAFIGFSLGGLLIASLVSENFIAKEAPIIYLAPALKIKLYSWLPHKILSAFPIPAILSFQKKQFIVHRFTPRDVYLSLYEGIKNLPRFEDYITKNPSLFIIHPKDELVDASTMLTDLKRLNSPHIELIEQSHSPLLGNYLHHLCFHQENLPKSDYQNLVTKMAQFLDTYS